jgi:hypothetical protein
MYIVANPPPPDVVVVVYGIIVVVVVVGGTGPGPGLTPPEPTQQGKSIT